MSQIRQLGPAPTAAEPAGSVNRLLGNQGGGKYEEIDIYSLINAIESVMCENTTHVLKSGV